ncbi:MAG: hypothetical protein JNN04_12855 [Cyclobacteriaceae bacterium]|nr:hypothetical protein [Cyclobacteriaceae bacterium]
MKAARQLLCMILLLLFTLEYVAATTAQESPIPASHQSKVLAHEIQGHFCLLAEESEERDHRDSDLLLFERALVHPHSLPSLSQGKLHGSDSFQTVLQSVPKYTLHRAIII